MRARLLELPKFLQLLACSDSRLSVFDCSKFHESCFYLVRSVMIWLKVKRLKHPYLWACQFSFNISTSNRLDVLYVLCFKNLITRENTRSARMLANYGKDNSIPVIVSLLDNHMIWSAYAIMMTGLRRVLQYSAFTKIVCLFVCLFFLYKSKQSTRDKSLKSSNNTLFEVRKMQAKGPVEHLRRGYTWILVKF